MTINPRIVSASVVLMTMLEGAMLSNAHGATIPSARPTSTATESWTPPTSSNCSATGGRVRNSFQRLAVSFQQEAQFSTACKLPA